MLSRLLIRFCVPSLLLGLTFGDGPMIRGDAGPPATETAPPASSPLASHLAELQSPDELVRLRAAVTLGRLGRSAEAALPALRKAIQDSDPDVRAAATRAVERIESGRGVNSPAPGALVLLDGQVSVRARLGPDDARDAARNTLRKTFSIALRQGREVVIDLVSKDFDAFLRLEDDEGRVVAYDDDSGGDLNSRLRITPRTDGVFRIVATSFGTEAAGEFALTVREAASGGVSSPVIDLATGKASIPGILAAGDPLDRVRNLPARTFSVHLVRGEKYRIDMTSRDLDSFLRLEDKAGTEVARDDDSGDNLDARIVYEPAESGMHRIVASSFGGQMGSFTLSVHRIRGDTPSPPDDPSVSDPPVTASLVSSRMVMSHGRVDDVRGEGYASPDHPAAQALPAISTLFRVIAAQPDPRKVTMDMNASFTGPRDGKVPSSVLTASADLPSSMALLVAELGPPALGQAVSRWQQAAPRFGNGNYYATVSMPEVGIVAGQELFTHRHFQVYTANSILWEAPDFGILVTSRNLEGGTTNLGVVIRRGSREKSLVLNVAWANPMELELAEVSQKRVPGPGKTTLLRVTLQATLPPSFEPTRSLRWAAETRKVNVLGQTPANVVRPNRVNHFVIDLPGDTEGMVRITAVASPGPFLRTLAEIKNEGTVRFTTFHSRGPTLEDTINILARPGNLEQTIQDKLDQAKAKSGDVQVSLYWQSRDDLDLHVVTPSGEQIYYGHRKSKCGGQLDVDMNVQYAKARSGAVENIFWPRGKAPPGKYKVYVHFFSHHGNQPGTADPAPFTVRVIIHGQSQMFSGTVSYASSSRRKVLVHEFSIP